MESLEQPNASHLEISFCLRKSQPEENCLSSQSFHVIEPQTRRKQTKRTKNLQNKNHNEVKRRPQTANNKSIHQFKYKRLTDMISHHINCSAAVNINQKMLNKTRSLKNYIKRQKHSSILIKVFSKEAEICKIQKQNVHGQFLSTLCTEPQEQLQIKSQKSYQKIRTQCSPEKGLVNNNFTQKQDNQTKVIVQKQTSQQINQKNNKYKKQRKYHKNLESKLKQKSNKFNSFERLTRTGLEIHPKNLQRNVKRNEIIFAENQKAINDKLFRKSLSKNSHAILTEIQGFQKHTKEYDLKQQIEQKIIKNYRPFFTEYEDDTYSKNVLSKYKRSFLKKHQSKKDNLEILRYTECLLNLQLNCQKNIRSTKIIKKSLKIFENYCGKVSKGLHRNYDGLVKSNMDALDESQLKLY